jgi:phosphoserine phosphatase RsbU/P
MAVLFVALVQGLPLAAQLPVFDASRLHGSSQLSAQWLVHGGDDPAYAQPGFDDSQWTLFDPASPIKKIFGVSRPDIVWYRLRVKVDPAQTDLALDETSLERAFEIYANGERVIQVGQVVPYAASTNQAHVLVQIPNRLLASGSLLLAIRVRITQGEWANPDYSPGYDAANLVIGQYKTLENERWLSILGDNIIEWFDDRMFIGLGVIALVLYVAQRSQRAYLWIFAVGVLTLLESIEPLISTFYPISQSWLIPNYVFRLAMPLIWGSLYLSFVHQRIGWRWRAFLIVAGFANLSGYLQGKLFYWRLAINILSNLPVIILFAAVIPGLLTYHWRRGNREAGILLFPALIFSLYIYLQVGAGIIYQTVPAWQPLAVQIFRAIQHTQVGPIAFNANEICDIGSVLALAIIILLRSTRMSRRQAQLESELEAAQQVQQVLVPEKTVAVPGFAVDAVYLPAQQVGGDFFQVLPAGDGGLLVVVGDVAGKGLPAAMLVSALVGSIRTAADDTHAPEVLLHRLNERMVGRTQGSFATALAAYISPGGAVTIANAGHLSPYLDGREVELSGALPLGITSPIRYETHSLQLPPGSRLTFYSDGVIEAQNQQGELFGFERAAAISTEPAPKVAQAAQAFGQQDDITVVTILREQAAASAA